MKDQKIIHVPRRFVSHEWGGTETVILEISKQQLAAGMNPRIMTSMALAQDGCDHETIQGVDVMRYRHLYPFWGLDAAGRAAMDKKGGNLFSWPLLKALYQERDVRLYHAHALKRLGGMVRTAARWNQKPYVVSLHGGIFDVPQAELADLTKPIQGKFEWGKPLGALLGARRVLEDADHVICVGESESIKAREQLSHDRVSYLPNGVDTARFAKGDGRAFRERYGIPEDAFLVVNMGRIDSQKNQLGLVRGFARFRAAVPGARLLMIGPVTQPAYLQQIRDLMAAEKLEDAVQIIPGLGNGSQDLVDAYHAADVFVLASRHEPFGIVVLEAWSAGRAVIVSRVGGLQSLVKDGETGLFFDPDAADADQQLARALQSTYEDPSMRQRMGCAGQKEAVERYEWSRICERLESIYQQAEEHMKQRKER
jgi:glycosyltransferase involved in cell wall biosynthesis